MKTPDEIKKGLEMCGVYGECSKCPYIQQCDEHIANGGDYRPADVILTDALALIQQVERERDAAVKDMRNAALCGCHVCKHYYKPDPNVRKYACKIHGSFDEHDFIADDGSIWCGAMEWRGVQKEVE